MAQELTEMSQICSSWLIIYIYFGFNSLSIHCKHCFFFLLWFSILCTRYFKHSFETQPISKGVKFLSVMSWLSQRLHVFESTYSCLSVSTTVTLNDFNRPLMILPSFSLFVQSSLCTASRVMALNEGVQILSGLSLSNKGQIPSLGSFQSPQAYSSISGFPSH